MLKRILVGIVVFCARARWLVLAIALAATAYFAFFVTQHFAIDTNINDLISPDLPWRQNQFAYQKAFPGWESTILAVIDAPTAELAQSAAERLTKRLKERHDWIRGANEGNGSPFFRRNGLLYLAEPELTSTLNQLSRSGPLLSRLTADPSLRGVMDSIGLSLRGVIFRRVSLETLAPEFQNLSDTINNVLDGKPASFSWSSQFQTGASKPPTRQFVTISPVLNFDALQPGEQATKAIRQTVADLKLPQQGVSVRLTGPVPIADDEFNTLRQGAGENAAITIAAVLFILWLALHSFRIILAVFLSVTVGLAATAAAGLSLVGALNPISIAFFVLFVGIGVDFCLQFSVSYRAARYEHRGLMRSLAETAANNGGRLVLAALATAAGFLSFLPTAFLGVAELGEIAGMGMIIALILSLTLLPALLRILNPPPEPSPLGYAFLCPLDRFMERHRIVIVAATVAAVFAASPLLYWLQFDTNPMDLRNPKVELVSTYLDISKGNPEVAGQTAELLAPSLDQANAIAKTLQALPEVAGAITLSSFIPENQDQKLAAIKKTADDLEDGLYPAEVKPAPTDAEVVSSLEATATSLAALANQRQGPGSHVAKELSDSLLRLANARPEMRGRAADVLIPPLDITLENLKASLNPERITLDTIPADSGLPVEDAGRPGARFGDAERGCEQHQRLAAVRGRGSEGRAHGDGRGGRHREGRRDGRARLHRGRDLGAAFHRRPPLAFPAQSDGCGAHAVSADPRRHGDAGDLLGDWLQAEFCEHHRLAGFAGPRRRVQNLLHGRLASGPDRSSGLALDSRRLLQRLDHGGGVRQPVDVEPSRHVEHGATACAVASLHDGVCDPVPAASHGAAKDKSREKPGSREGSVAARVTSQSFHAQGAGNGAVDCKCFKLKTLVIFN